MRGIYLVGGYPSRKDFKRFFSAVEENGFDFVEIGIPFSESVADGPIITKALQNVINNGISVFDILDDLKTIKTNMNVYIMTYANIVYSYGLKRFSTDFGKLIKGLILADVPNKMHDFFYRQDFNIPLIPFITPESTEKDINNLRESRADFIYYIGIRGITGDEIKTDDLYEIEASIRKIKQISDKRVVLGFGIKDKQNADQALQLADGYVIGTAAVAKQQNFEDYNRFLKSLNFSVK